MGDEFAARERGPWAEPRPGDDVVRAAPEGGGEISGALAFVVQRQSAQIESLVALAREQGAKLDALARALARPPKRPRKPLPVRQESFREEHLTLVMACAPNEVTAVYIAVALDSGLRRSELLALDWNDVDLERRALIVRHGKGDKFRIVFTTARAMALMARLSRSQPWVFCHPSTGSRLRARFVNIWVRETVQLSGVERAYAGKKIRIHAMRRGHATNANERGVDLRSVQEQLGHVSIRTTEGYVDLRMDHREKMRTRFEQGTLPLPTAGLLGDVTRRPPSRAGRK